MQTFMAKAQDISRKWYLIDATEKTLGRLATEIATILKGKNKPIYTPHVDTGDFVIVVNAEKVKLTGNKLQDKLYITHSGYPGGLKKMNYEALLQKKPELVIEKAVKGMLPHNRLGAAMYKKLKVYKGPEHPHQAQQPEVWELRG
ncbi:MAG: 50S ribosomal protein L13 [Clostridia bacterium]|nr:50S ribosomal protein L13 [Clostridia bacterium]MDD4666292.1 50S ribosomal protein L13 [Clostridia bacterium]